MPGGGGMTVTIHQGDCRELLTTMPAASVNCIITSPPYYGLRDYGVTPNEWPAIEFFAMPGLPPVSIPAMTCCHGLEPDPWAFIGHEVLIFRECRRVLHDDGTLWLNIGDSYSTDGGPGWQGKNGQRSDRRFTGTRNTVAMREQARAARDGYKPKDLMGIPWMLAFALRADGWYLRQDIIWSKPNPMPESVRDRCTKAHEYLFLLSKSERYYWDRDAIAERASSAWDPDNCKAPDGWDTGEGDHGSVHRAGREKGRSGNKARKPASARGVPIDTNGEPRGAVAGSVPWEGSTRNKRSVWEVATQPFKGAHFATFPPALVEPCILAGCPEGGTVLDPFGGAGTTGLVADRMQRNAILIELNPEYAAIARRRITADAPLLTEVA